MEGSFQNIAYIFWFFLSKQYYTIQNFLVEKKQL